MLSQRDEVDAVSLDATHAFIAGKCGLVPVVTEYYGMADNNVMVRELVIYQGRSLQSVSVVDSFSLHFSQGRHAYRLREELKKQAI